MSGPGVTIGTTGDARAAGGLTLSDAAIGGRATKVAFTKNSAKLLVSTPQIDTMMVVEKPAEMWQTRAQAVSFAAQFADAPTRAHPTIVSVVDVGSAKRPALLFDPIIDVGMHPETPRLRSVATVVGDRQIEVMMPYGTTSVDDLLATTSRLVDTVAG